MSREGRAGQVQGRYDDEHAEAAAPAVAEAQGIVQNLARPDARLSACRRSVERQNATILSQSQCRQGHQSAHSRSVEDVRVLHRVRERESALGRAARCVRCRSGAQILAGAAGPALRFFRAILIGLKDFSTERFQRIFFSAKHPWRHWFSGSGFGGDRFFRFGITRAVGFLL